MRAYEYLKEPIEHLGAEDHVTATQLRNVLSRIDALASGRHPDQPSEPEPEPEPRRGSVDNSDPVVVDEPEPEPEVTDEPEAETPEPAPEPEDTEIIPAAE